MTAANFLPKTEIMANIHGKNFPSNVSWHSLQSQRELLPIHSARGPLIREILANDSCVVVGETGSGKTTQIPQVHIIP